VATTATDIPPDGTVTSHVKFVVLTAAGTPLHVTETIPDPASNATPETTCVPGATTALNAGELIAMTGGVLSIRTVTETEVSPYSFDALRVTCRMPSAATVTGPGQTTVPGPVHANDTVTSVLFQPAAFGVGETVATMSGGTSVTVQMKVASGLDASDFTVNVVTPWVVGVPLIVAGNTKPGAHPGFDTLAGVIVRPGGSVSPL